MVPKACVPYVGCPFRNRRPALLSYVYVKEPAAQPISASNAGRSDANVIGQAARSYHFWE
jgi:hypothetical protein